MKKLFRFWSYSKSSEVDENLKERTFYTLNSISTMESANTGCDWFKIYEKGIDTFQILQVHFFRFPLIFSFFSALHPMEQKNFKGVLFYFWDFIYHLSRIGFFVCHRKLCGKSIAYVIFHDLQVLIFWGKVFMQFHAVLYQPLSNCVGNLAFS